MTPQESTDLISSYRWGNRHDWGQVTCTRPQGQGLLRWNTSVGWGLYYHATLPLPSVHCSALMGLPAAGWENIYTRGWHSAEHPEGAQSMLTPPLACEFPNPQPPPHIPGLPSLSYSLARPS